MKNKVAFYKRFSVFFFIFFLVSLSLTIGSIVIQVKDNMEYKDCKIVTTGKLSSCFTQENGNKTYYFGVYSFTYKNASFNFVNTTYYSSEDKVPEKVTIKHNEFEKKDDMKCKVKYDRMIAIPVIYAVITFILFALFYIYNASYKAECTLVQMKNNSKDVNAELDDALGFDKNNEVLESDEDAVKKLDEAVSAAKEDLEASNSTIDEEAIKSNIMSYSQGTKK